MSTSTLYLVVFSSFSEAKQIVIFVLIKRPRLLTLDSGLILNIGEFHSKRIQSDVEDELTIRLVNTLQLNALPSDIKCYYIQQEATSNNSQVTLEVSEESSNEMNFLRELREANIEKEKKSANTGLVIVLTVTFSICVIMVSVSVLVCIHTIRHRMRNRNSGEKPQKISFRNHMPYVDIANASNKYEQND